MLAGILMLSAMPAYSGDLVAGWLETVAITEKSFSVRAKLDTGADSSSLNAVNSKITGSDGEQYISFSITNMDGKTLDIMKKIIRWTSIKNKFNIVRERPVVNLQVCLGTVVRSVEVNLVDRSNYKYQMLIGRSFLRGEPNILIDSARDYIHVPQCATDSMH